MTLGGAWGGQNDTRWRLGVIMTLGGAWGEGGQNDTRWRFRGSSA